MKRLQRFLLNLSKSSSRVTRSTNRFLVQGFSERISLPSDLHQSILEVSAMTINVRDFDFIWWRDRHHRPSRLVVPVAIHSFPKNNIIVVKQNPFNLSGGSLAELIRAIIFEDGIDLKKCVVLSMPSSSCWGWHTFILGKSILGGYKPLEASTASALLAGKIDFTPYLALPKKEKMTPTQVEVITFKSH